MCKVCQKCIVPSSFLCFGPTCGIAINQETDTNDDVARKRSFGLHADFQGVPSSKIVFVCKNREVLAAKLCATSPCIIGKTLEYWHFLTACLLFRKEKEPCG